MVVSWPQCPHHATTSILSLSCTNLNQLHISLPIAYFSPLLSLHNYGRIKLLCNRIELDVLMIWIAYLLIYNFYMKYLSTITFTLL